MYFNNIECKIRITKSLGSKTGTVSIIFFYNDFIEKNNKNNINLPLFLITKKFIYSSKNIKIFWLNGKPRVLELIFIFFNDQKLTEFLVELKKEWEIKGLEKGL